VKARLFFLLALSALPPLAGCAGPPNPSTAPGVAPAAREPDAAAEARAALAQLPAEDRKLAEAQKFCAVQTDNLLGSMGPPVKVTVKGRAVFLCCKGCRTKALADPDRTLARLEELKKRAAGTPSK
jgi:hypothetical protein